MKIRSFMRLKLSNRLQRALDDLKAIEKDPNFLISMGLWACPVGDTNLEDFKEEGAIGVDEKPKATCAVCHAGSVLAKSINGKLFKELMEKTGTSGIRLDEGTLQEVSGEDYEVIEKFENFLKAVNAVRENDLGYAAQYFGLNYEFFDKFKHGDKHVEYEDDPKGYKKWFQLVVNYVARQGK